MTKKERPPSMHRKKSQSRDAKPSPSTSWNGVGKWYNHIVGKEGHYYHQKIILPAVLRMLSLTPASQGSLLDLACGQGVLARALPSHITYCGVDIAAHFIEIAQQQKGPNQQFFLGDITRPLPVDMRAFDCATMILALQNIAHPLAALQRAAEHLVPEGRFLIVINHPCFRIPRQSSWEVDAAQKMQYRRLQAYLSPLKIPIQMHPGKGAQSEQTWSFHHPLSSYVQWLHTAGFVVETMEEWVSDKVSEGGAAVMENRARREFPLFLAILAQKRPA